MVQKRPLKVQPGDGDVEAARCRIDPVVMVITCDHLSGFLILENGGILLLRPIHVANSAARFRLRRGSFCVSGPPTSSAGTAMNVRNS